MINTVLFDCASTYLYKTPERATKIEPQKKVRRVEANSAVYTGKKFNANSAVKANHNHIDICI